MIKISVKSNLKIDTYPDTLTVEKIESSGIQFRLKFGVDSSSILDNTISRFEIKGYNENPQKKIIGDVSLSEDASLKIRQMFGSVEEQSGFLSEIADPKKFVDSSISKSAKQDVRQQFKIVKTQNSIISPASQFKTQNAILQNKLLNPGQLQSNIKIVSNNKKENFSGFEMSNEKTQYDDIFSIVDNFSEVKYERTSDTASIARVSFFVKSENLYSEIGYKPLWLQIEARDKSGVIISSYTLPVSLQTMLEPYDWISTPPTVYQTNIKEFSKTVFQLQSYEDVSSINVYKKSINTNSPISSNFVMYDSIQLQSGSSKIEVASSKDSTSIYRFVPVSKKFQESSAFTECAVRSETTQAQKYCLFSLKNTEKSILVEVSYIPNSVVSFSVFSRKQTNESYVLVDGKINYVDGREFYTIEDFSPIVDGEIYEYVVDLHYKDGITRRLPSQVFERVITKNVVNTLVENLVTNIENRDISFTIQTSINKSNITNFLDLLKNQGTDSLYIDEIKQEKSNIDNLVSYYVERIDLDTGIQHSYGIVEKDFSESKYSLISQVPRPELGKSYRYQITTLTRDFNSSVDSVDKKETSKFDYKYNVYKFFHPVVKSTGAIVSKKSIQEFHPKDELSFGSLSQTTVDVVFGNTSRSIDSVQPEILGDFLKITWVYLGDVRKDIDHFIIYKTDESGTNVFQLSNFLSTKIIKKISVEDFGEAIFSVVPVYHDYSFGQIKSSQKILIMKS